MSLRPRNQKQSAPIIMTLMSMIKHDTTKYVPIGWMNETVITAALPAIPICDKRLGGAAAAAVASGDDFRLC